MKQVLFILTSIYLLIPVVKAEESSWYELDGIKFRNGQANTEYKVSTSSLGPATLANNLSPNTTNSDKTPSLTKEHSFPLAGEPLSNL